MNEFKLSYAKVTYGPQAYDIHGLPERLDQEEVIRALVKIIPNLKPEDIEVTRTPANQFHGEIVGFSAFGNAVTVTYKK